MLMLLSFWLVKAWLLRVQNQICSGFFFILFILLTPIFYGQEEDHIYISRCFGLVGLPLRALGFGGLSLYLELFLMS
jgi:hypothetical protein